MVDKRDEQSERKKGNKPEEKKDAKKQNNEDMGEKEPKEPKVQRVEAQSAPEPSGSYMEIWMAIFARLREFSNEREQACCEETEPESAPLPDGAVLADLVGYALAHDLGLLVGGN